MTLDFGKKLSLLFLVPIILFVFILGFYLGKIQAIDPLEGILGREVNKPEEVDFAIFWDVWRKLEGKFIGRETIDRQEMIEGAISGMIETLEDPHTIFLSPKETEWFIKNMEGVFEGVGMKIGIKNEQLQVIAPIKETPAYRAGLQAGDKIIKIDGVSTINMAVGKAVTLIRGPRGTRVILKIFREKWDEKREVEIKRGVIKIPSLSWELIEENIAHLKIYYFTERNYSDFKKIVNEILDSPAEKIILDLRNNPGGCLGATIDIAGWFLERRQIVVIEEFGVVERRKYHQARGNEKLLIYPIVILINSGSASGAEILAGALRDNRGTQIIGERSFGKGSVQNFKKLRDGFSLKVTVANWLTPKGILIANYGLKPDITIEITPDDHERGYDPQLTKAIEVLKEMK